MSIPFRPFQGTESLIEKQTRYPGHVYFATDSGKIFLDTETDRLVVGGGGVSILYASAKEVNQDLVDFTYLLYKDTDLDNKSATPKVNDLILNSDGRFFKIVKYIKDTGLMKCKLIAISGTGGGPSTPDASGPHVTLKCTGTSPDAQTYIYGQPQNIEFTATATDDAIVTLQYMVTGVSSEETKIYTETVYSGTPHIFDLGSKLNRGLNTLKIVASASNSGSYDLTYSNINAISMTLSDSDSFNPLNYAYNNSLTFYCIPEGEVTKTLEIYLNNSLATKETYNSTYSGQITGITIPKQDHGVYKLKALLTYSTGLTKVPTLPLEHEVAFVDPDNSAPLIWFNHYSETITDHDKLTLKFMVYDPASPNNTSVKRYINGVEITELEEVSYSRTEWIEWNISNYNIGKNTFSLQCGTTTREIVIYVEEDLVRNLDIVDAGLYLNLDTFDRSNKENKTSREKWEYKHADGSVTSVKFNNFNWYNNGWITDTSLGNSILRISNGASINIPLSVMNTTDLQNSLTFEMRFKLRNVQKYENLISISSEVIGVNEFGEDIIKVTKTVSSTEGVWGKYYNNNIGMCLGTQEGFFKGQTAIASGRYKEDQIVTVSFVIEAKTATNAYPLIYMYIDGVMCSIIEYDKSNESFKSEANTLIINSDYCDVDLIGIRIYKAALSSSEIVQNYLADQNNALLYDINQIVAYNEGTPTIDYTAMINYNKNHPDQLLCPYAVLECTDKKEDKLPFVKDGKRKLNVTFVNPSLDQAYKNGDITDEEYLCGAPSFYATNIEFDVQGTSSQGYPRRNFKGKFKKADDNSWKYTSGPLKDKEIGEKNTYQGIDYKNFYMDNTYSESSFTWKADYMESSMTHNTGFASFVNTLYDYHPLQNYDSNIDVTNRRTTVYGFPMMVFQKTARVNEKDEPIFEFVGRYNFNLDKGCNNVIGFKEKASHPYVEGTDFEHISECWELKHNQGGRVAFTRANFAETNSDGDLTVVGDFEVRYHFNEDDIENAIKGKKEWETKSQAERNSYILDKYANLERLVEWLSSTDTIPVSGADYEPVDLPQEVIYGTGDHQERYTKDTREYRLAKFKNEFSKHLNLHYCAIYFIMTEFLIQYDSRGKNMMIGTWGPQEAGGDYIWYPIYYDIDTQLGVNNSGVPSWEYYDEPTEQNEFSTANSVLWNNFYECFKGTITDTYNNLRKNVLTYEKLNGYYSYDSDYILYKGYDGQNHNSYAMKGHRPINVINVDQYYKYIAPTFTGYLNTKGTISYDYARRFYCLQGTRELHRELFLRNRFNFMDSKWLGGSYAIEGAKQEFQIRTNANKYTPGGMTNTSDRFLDRAPTIEELELGFSQDPENPLNSEWTWNITPYLRQYVSIYYDEILQRNPVEYEGDGMPIPVRYKDINEDNVKNVVGFGQQLSYIGGAEYISSLGDISLKYPDEIYLTELKRLKDIRLGNDTEGYVNNALTKCILGAEAKNTKNEPNPNAKNLLENVVLTGVSSLNASIDITGSEKLKEFRALRTNIQGVSFADGVQAETIHLPDTVTFIDLTEPVALERIVDNPNPSGIDSVTGYNIYPNGLYIEGVTDENKASSTLINKYSLTGGIMGYESYKLLKNLVDIKKTMQEAENLDPKYSKTISISLKGVDWTPYRLVAYGEEMDNDKTYKKATDNSTLENYNLTEINAIIQNVSSGTAITNDVYEFLIRHKPELKSNFTKLSTGYQEFTGNTQTFKNIVKNLKTEAWNTDTLNQIIYEVNAEKESQKTTITDLSILDLFLDTNNNLKEKSQNYFQDTVEYSDNRVTYPKITGNIFVANSEPISEYDIKNHYNVYYPDLKILVENVASAYTAKFVEINPETNQEIVLETLKYSKDIENAKVNKNDITASPSRLHHDFIGWSLDGINVLSEDEWENLVFNNEKQIYIFYAMFDITSYTAYFKDLSTTYNETVTTSYGTNYSNPKVLPSRDDEEKLMELKDRIAFKGWTTRDDLTSYIVSEAELIQYSSDPASYVAERDYTFYALYVMENALTTPSNADYFVCTPLTASTCKISGNKNYSLRGKLTIPATYVQDGITYSVTSIGDFKNALMTSHIFFEQGSQCTKIEDEAFFNLDETKETAVQGIYLPETVTYIGNRAFKATTSLQHLSNKYIENAEQFRGYLNSNISYIGEEAFRGKLLEDGKYIINELPESLTHLGKYAFWNAGNNIYFSVLPKNLQTVPEGAFVNLKNISISNFGDLTADTPLTTIEKDAFKMNRSNSDGVNRTVTEVKFFNTVKNVGNNAFAGYGANPKKPDMSDNYLSTVKVYTQDTDWPDWFSSYTGFENAPTKFTI